MTIDTKQGEPVAWVDVVDTYEGPYHFHGQAFLPKGRHSLYAHPDPRAAVLEGLLRRWVAQSGKLSQADHTILTDTIAALEGKS